MKKISKKNRPAPHTRYVVNIEQDLSKVITYHWDDIVEIKFAMATETKERLIGVVDKQARVMHVKRSRNRHLYQKTMSYGFNYYILKNAKLFDHVALKDEKDSWHIPVSFILEKGQFKHYKNNGNFELQKFVSLVELTPYECNNML